MQNSHTDGFTKLQITHIRHDMGWGAEIFGSAGNYFVSCLIAKMNSKAAAAAPGQK